MINERLKELAVMSNLNQAEVAELINTTPAAVSQYFAGERHPQIEVIKKICAKFNVSSDWLLGIGKDSPRLKQKIIGRILCPKCETRFQITELT